MKNYEKLKIIIKRRLVSYDIDTNKLSYCELSVTKTRKNGFLVFDGEYRKIGIAFTSDDKNKPCFGNTKLLFFKQYNREFGIRRIIKINKQYLPFITLMNILIINNEYCCVLDGRRSSIKKYNSPKK